MRAHLCARVRVGLGVHMRARVRGCAAKAGVRVLGQLQMGPARTGEEQPATSVLQETVRKCKICWQAGPGSQFA